MSLLSELLADTRPPANSANPANPRVADGPAQPEISKLAKLAAVQDSSVRPDTVELRTRLLELADLHGIDPAIVHALPESELCATAAQLAGMKEYEERKARERQKENLKHVGSSAPIGTNDDAGRTAEKLAQIAGVGRRTVNRAIRVREHDEALLVYLHLLADDADRKAGRVPKGHTAKMLCSHCGPVWIHPSIAAVLPVVGGWPRGLGCPWCFIHPKGLRIPRPRVVCVDCTHFVRDAMNPVGMGRCAIDANHGGTNWPHQQRQCGRFEPRA